MKNYYRIMLGQKSVYVEECFTGNFIGTDFGINQDLVHKLPEEWRAFNKEADSYNKCNFSRHSNWVG